MQTEDLLKPRFLLAAMAFVIVGVLMGIGELDQSSGLMVIMGILVSFGAYSRSGTAQAVVGRVTGRDED